MEVKDLDENIRILVVDDDENIRKVLVAILQDEGYTVDSVGTARKGIDATKRRFYNVALLDIRLPDMEGTELLTQLKDTTPRMRKIIITGYPTLQNAIEAVNRRADAYIMKPFDVKKVLETIEDQLKKQEEERKYSQDKVAEFIETRVKELNVDEIRTKEP
jgi:DNA-binding NtrC family response regulator